MSYKLDLNNKICKETINEIYNILNKQILAIYYAHDNINNLNIMDKETNNIIINIVKKFKDGNVMLDNPNEYVNIYHPPEIIKQVYNKFIVKLKKLINSVKYQENRLIICEILIDNKYITEENFNSLMLLELINNHYNNKNLIFIKNN